MSIEAGFSVPETWLPVLKAEISSQKSFALKKYIADEIKSGKVIFPPEQLCFQALEATPPHAVKVVILGQDPYHGEDQAHGLAFSVLDGVKQPPSLKNIFKELHRDLGVKPRVFGSLAQWANQGVLLLNTVLSVEMAKAGSHQGKGWEEITDAIIAHAGAQASPCVFMLWGAHAQKKKLFINAERHLILEAPHPSPLSAHRGFIGCGHFSAANEFLSKNGLSQIDWS